MILIIGPLAGGKRTFVKQTWGYRAYTTRLGERAPVFYGAEALAAGEEAIDQLAEQLTRYPVVILNETGGGIVPLSPEVRRARERAGRLACRLAGRAETVVRVWYSLPQVLKGALP